MPVESSDPNIEKKSPQASTDRQTPATAIATGTTPQSNILNRYRSYTYNFTLSVLDKDAINDPSTSFLSANYTPKFIMAKSGGKGNNAFPNNLGAGVTANLNNTVQAAAGGGATGNGTNSTVDAIKSSNISSDQSSITDMINEFNTNSHGRFDMYIDNVEIKTAMTFSEGSNTTQVLGVSFDVFEPLSVSGFIESLQASAIASGWLSHMACVYLLKLQFSGYKDSVDISEPETEIDKGTRYIPIIFSKITVDVGQDGTRYKCTCVPPNQSMLGDAYDQLKHPVKVKGKTVGELLRNLMSSATTFQEIEDSSGKKGKFPSNTYKIEFLDDEGNVTDKSPIDKAIINEFLKDDGLYSFDDPAVTNKVNAYHAVKGITTSTTEQGEVLQSIKIEPGKTAVQFQNGANIHAIISSIIRDSQYLANKMKDMATDSKKVIDSNDMFDFWLININVKYLENDPYTNSVRKEITYTVNPWKVHYTQLPEYSTQIVDPNKVARLVNREYNYIYTGKNIDITSFKINFDSLFYTSMIPGNGNSNNIPASKGAAPDNRIDVKRNPIKGTQVINSLNGQPMIFATDKVSGVVVNNEPNSGPNNTDVYKLQARNAFRSLLKDSRFALLTGDLEIIGDPYYVVTGGIGNIKHKPGDNVAILDNGEANHQYGQLIISINFQNPLDINPLSAGGTVQFNTRKVAFQGYYRVNTVRSIFKDGMFKQVLSIGRLVGLPDSPKQTPDDPGSQFLTSPKATDQIVKDASTAIPLDKRSTSLADVISGVSQITNSISAAKAKIVGAISGITSAVSNLQSQVSNVVNSANQITAKIQGVSSSVANAGSQFGLSVSQLKNLNPQNILSLIAAVKKINSNINLSALENQGVLIPPVDKINNLPPVAPATAVADGKTINGKFYTWEEIQKIRDASAASGVPVSAYFGISSSSASG